MGTICVLAWRYFSYFGKKERSFDLFIVGILLCLNLCQFGMYLYVAAYGDTSCVKKWRSRDIAYRAGTWLTSGASFYFSATQTRPQKWPMCADPALTAVIVFLVQLVSTKRCGALTGTSKSCGTLMTLLLFVSLGSGLGYSIILLKLERFTDAWTTFTPITTIVGWLLSMTVLDFIIFVLSISKLRSLRTSQSEYYKLAFKLVHWISLTTDILLSILLLFSLLPHTTYYLIPQFSVGRIYTLRLLTTLLWRGSPPLLGPQSNDGSAADHGVTILSVETLVEPGRSQADDAA
ncbi:hypothetical protein DFH06DRAFT_1335412 [Mycena polygramma]|nr:hypothetical protein DFH06DRAFT_1335412 [Mycena polygramma]